MRAAIVLLFLLLTVPAAAAEFGAYDEYGFPLSVDGESTNPYTFGPVNVVEGVTVYPYYPLLTMEVQRLAEEHPDLVKLHSAGKSTAGLDLWMLEIADFARIDAGEGRSLDEREVVWIDGGTHSNEYSGVYFVGHLASFLADQYETNETARWIVENRHTWIMPMVNPDGSNAFGRLNARAVNVNRNYPVAWGEIEETPLLNNPGPEPASEVETQINIEWFNKTQPDYYASIHCCGNLWLYPYGVEGLDPVDRQVFDGVCDAALAEVRSDCGPIWSTIYPASGSSVDTAYEYTGAVAFGFEMSGRGALALWGQPFTTESVEVQERESWNAVMHALLNVEKYGARPEIAAVRAEGDALVARVRNVGYGNLTAGTISVGGASVALPWLAPGSEAEVTIPADLAPGESAITLAWTKREMAAPQGLAAQKMSVVEGLLGGVSVSLLADDGKILPQSTGAAKAPGIAPLGALVLISLVAIARRR